MLGCIQICTSSHVWVLVSLVAPLGGRILAVEWILEFNDVAVPLTQEILLLSVILHQLGQSGKLLATVKVIVVTRVLDLNVGHLIVPPAQNETLSYVCQLRWTQS